MSRVRIHSAQFVLGLLLALTLWTYVSFSTNPNATAPVTTPVELVGLADDLIIVNSETGEAESFAATTTLSVSGPEDAIDDLTAEDFRATANLAGLESGVNSVRIEVERPPFVRVETMVPGQLTLRLARELVTTVPITVALRGQPPFSFTVGDMTQGANETSVRGPENLVERVVAAVAEVDLQGQTGNLASTFPLTAVDASGEPVEGVTLTPERVPVQVPIIAQVEVQQVSIVPQLTGQPAQGFAVGSINWDPKIIEVFTPRAITGTLNTEPIELNGLTEGITTTVGLERPANIITRPAIVRVTVRVDIVPIGVPSQLPLLVAVSPVGISPGLTSSAEPTAIQLTLSGPLNQLTRLALEDVLATVNLAGLGPGTYLLPVRVELPPGLTTLSPADPRVRVTISALPTPAPEPEPTTPPSTAAP